MPPLPPLLSRTWVCQGNLLNGLCAHVSPNRRDGNQHYRTSEADDDRVEVSRLVVRSPFHVPQRLAEEERGGRDAGHVCCVMCERGGFKA